MKLFPFIYHLSQLISVFYLLFNVSPNKEKNQSLNYQHSFYHVCNTHTGLFNLRVESPEFACHGSGIVCSYWNSGNTTQTSSTIFIHSVIYVHCTNTHSLWLTDE